MTEHEIKIPANFNFNVLSCLRDSLDSGIESGRNIVGGSQLALGYRKNVLMNLNPEVKVVVNNKMLWGMMYEALLYERSNLKAFIIKLNDILGLPLPSEVDTKKAEMWEAFPKELPGYFIRMHPDIYTNQYTVEIKTTGVQMKFWSTKLAPYQVCQENFYMGYYKQSVGFLHKLNIRAFINKFNTMEELWDKWGYFKEVYFDKEFFDLALVRAKFMFQSIEAENIYIPCPEEIWECSTCDVIDKCKNPITKQRLDYSENCAGCGGKIELTLKKSGIIDALCYVRNGKYFHGNDQKDSERWNECHVACREAWRYDAE